jgi:hypothetical protein
VYLFKKEKQKITTVFYHFAACDNSPLCYRKEYLNSILTSVFGVAQNYIDITNLINEWFRQKLSDIFGVEVPRNISKKYVNACSDTGVAITEATFVYKITRELWRPLPA